MTDEQLTARARDGDLAAFGLLVDRHRAAVVRAAIAALGNREDAEDVAQETFVHCHRKLDTFRGASSLRTWLVAAAWRRALSRRRSLARWVAHRRFGWAADADPACPASLADPEDPSPTPERQVIERDAARRLAALVRALPAKLRDPLLLAAGGDYSMEEIARLVRAPVGTVKWRISEARRLVREKLARLEA